MTLTPIGLDRLLLTYPLNTGTLNSGETTFAVLRSFTMTVSTSKRFHPPDLAGGIMRNVGLVYIVMIVDLSR